ncbi:hypothetical protein [Tropicimonas aquimaris]|uniref:DUF883 domain-containing protein n=1 Tax=Tropicimonas aquimaris TaxID=914152 RepID=A0ABW3IWG0_9RHOB
MSRGDETKKLTDAANYLSSLEQNLRERETFDDSRAARKLEIIRRDQYDLLQEISAEIRVSNQHLVEIAKNQKDMRVIVVLSLAVAVGLYVRHFGILG